MRAGLRTIQQTLTPEVAAVLNHSIAEAGRRNHGQTTPLLVAATLLAAPSGFLRQACLMEHGSYHDASQSTFSFTNENHTLANSLRFMLNQYSRVSFCGYSIPHPSDPRVNIRVQTTGDPARKVLKDSCEHLTLMCQHVRSTFKQAVEDFKDEKGVEAMQVEK